LKECQDRKVNIIKLEVDHKVKLNQRFKSNANIILEEELIETLNHDDAVLNALFEVAIIILDKDLDPHWYVDSCVFRHVIGNSDMVNKLHKQIYPSIVSIVGSESHQVENISSVHFETPNGVIKTIDNVLYVERLKKNLLSIEFMATKGYLIVFYDKRCLIIRKSDYKFVAFGNHMANRLYNYSYIIELILKSFIM
jgi:hypothetical protein